MTVNVLSTAVTGYGEDMVKSALNIDHGIVETMAHLTGAQYVEPDVSFVLDIGGQDMKSIFIRDGVIANIELNEACSSGCGSFLQNSASAMNLSLPEFTEAACLADHPGDLGSCHRLHELQVKRRCARTPPWATSRRASPTPSSRTASSRYSRYPTSTRWATISWCRAALSATTRLPCPGALSGSRHPPITPN